MAEETTGMVSGAGQGAATGAQIGGPWGALIGGVIGGAAGLGMGNGVKQSRIRKENTIAEYMSQLAALDMPRYEDLKLALQRYANGEQLTPDQLTALQDVDSEIQKITQDKQAKQTQLEALAQMKLRARGGLTLQDQADLQRAQQEIDRQNIGVQKSIMQNMAARGQSGSGSEMAARLMAAQNGAQLSSQNSLQTAGRAQSAAMQSLRDAASLGRTMGQDQLDFDAMKAKAADETRRSNLERLQKSMEYNIGTNNNAKLANWNRANMVADKNVDIANTEQVRNKQALMDDYNNQVGRVNQRYTGAYGAISGKEDGQKRAQDEYAGLMGGLNAIGGLAGGLSSQPKAQQTVSPTIIKNDDEQDDYKSKLGGGNWSFE